MQRKLQIIFFYNRDTVAQKTLAYETKYNQGTQQYEGHFALRTRNGTRFYIPIKFTDQQEKDKFEDAMKMSVIKTVADIIKKAGNKELEEEILYMNTPNEVRTEMLPKTMQEYWREQGSFETQERLEPQPQTPQPK